MPAPSPSPHDAPSLSERPGADLFTEAGGEVRFDAVTADVTADEARGQLQERKLGIGFWIATGWLVVLFTLAILAPWLPFVKDPSELDTLALRQPAAWSQGGSWRPVESTATDSNGTSPTFHLFGADDLGRDIFSRVIWGARVSLFIGVVAVALGFLIGGTIGLNAGYFRGRFEKIFMSAMDIMLAFPALILALAIVTFLSEPGSQDASIGTITLTLTILAIPALARITRASTLTFSQREFVQAARTLGAKNGRIIVREILPNVIPPMVSFSLIAIAIVIVAEGGLSFLGLSVSAPTPTWGNMINEGRTALEIAPHIALIPCAVMFVTLLSFNYAGDQLRRRFDVQEARL